MLALYLYLDMNLLRSFLSFFCGIVVPTLSPFSLTFCFEGSISVHALMLFPLLLNFLEIYWMYICFPRILLRVLVADQLLEVTDLWTNDTDQWIQHSKLWSQLKLLGQYIFPYSEWLDWKNYQCWMKLFTQPWEETPASIINPWQ